MGIRRTGIDAPSAEEARPVAANGGSLLATRRAALGITAVAAAGLLAERGLLPDPALAAEGGATFSAQAVSTSHVETKGIPSASLTDGVLLEEGQIVLLTNQSGTAAIENGPWVVKKAAWTRPTAFAEASEQFGILMPVVAGEVYAGTLWLLADATKVKVGSQAQTWTLTNALVTGLTITGLGRDALPSANAYTENTAVGTEALFDNTYALFNTAVGYRACYSVKPKMFTFKGTVKVGSNQITGIPAGAEREQFGKTEKEVEVYKGAYLRGEGIPSGFGEHVAIESMAKLLTEGTIVMATNATAEHVSETISAYWGGGFNTAVGWYALSQATTGAGNVAIGCNALSHITTGEENIAIGCETQTSAKVASYNTSIGFRALASNLTGTRNVAIGYMAMRASESGSYNVVLGNNALEQNLTGSNNVAIGYECLQRCTSSYNVAIGGLEALTSGEKNTALGHEALEANKIGSGNVAIGYRAAAKATGSNLLYIANTETEEPLIKGVFPNEELIFNTTKIALYKGVTPVARHATIGVPGETLVANTKAIKEIIEAIKAIGIIS